MELRYINRRCSSKKRGLRFRPMDTRTLQCRDKGNEFWQDIPEVFEIVYTDVVVEGYYDGGEIYVKKNGWVKPYDEWKRININK